MKKIILTGATGGLGTELVDTILSYNIGELVCVYRNEKKFNKIRNEQKKLKGYQVLENDDFSKLFSWVEDKETNEIMLILNAFSITPIKKMGEMRSDEIENFVYGNITRNTLLINKTINHCKINGIALRIINLDSGAADRPFTGWGNYCASKSFINSLLSVVSKENSDYRVVSVDPGVIDTNMQEEIRSADKEVFDQVEMFKDYKKKGLLKSPKIVAIQICEKYLINWTAKFLREKLE